MAENPTPGSVTVLVVDDEEPIRNALKRFLALQHFQVLTAGSGAEALQALRAQSVAVMLCDIRMPGTSGVDLVPQALAVAPDLAILMLSAVNDATTAALCMQRGAMDYLTKPIELDELSRAVQRGLRRREANIEGRHGKGTGPEAPKTTRSHEEGSAPGAAGWPRERARLERLTVATLEALVNALEAKDPYLRGHSARVADLSATIAANIGMSEDEIEQVRLAGRLHDIGKIGTREAVMNKQGPLTPEEYDHVKQHVLIGWQILSPLTHLGPVLDGIRHHHERWDGTGYPDGLAGEEIPIGARIVSIVDVWDALSTDRPYKRAYPQPKVREILEKYRGNFFEPALVDLFLEILDDEGKAMLALAGGGRP